MVALEESPLPFSSYSLGTRSNNRDRVLHAKLLHIRRAVNASRKRIELTSSPDGCNGGRWQRIGRFFELRPWRCS